MEKTKFDLFDLLDEISNIKTNAEKICLLFMNISVSFSDRESAMFLDITFDYNQKIIESLGKIEDILEEEINNYE